MSLTYSAAVEQTITAGEQIHQIVNGTATTEVTVEDGSKVPSIRKALLDNFYFKDPIAWQVGQTENVFNQLRQFTDGSWWYAPSATASNPISMGSTPIGNSLWKIYDFDAIGKLTPQIRESLRRSCAEARFNLVDGSFEAGGTLVNANDVLLQERTGKAFSGPAGTVAAGTNPASGGFVDRSGELLRDKLALDSGAGLIGTLDGRTVQERFDNIPAEVDTAGTAAALISQHNSSSAAHPELSAFISAEANRAEAAAESVKPYVDRALSDLSTAANKFYPTLAKANADIANINVNQPVTVGEAVNGGLWYKATAGATSLTKSPYDPLTQAKAYTDQAGAAAANDATTKANTAEANANTYTDEEIKKVVEFAPLDLASAILDENGFTIAYIEKDGVSHASDFSTPEGSLSEALEFTHLIDQVEAKKLASATTDGNGTIVFGVNTDATIESPYPPVQGFGIDAIRSQILPKDKLNSAGVYLDRLSSDHLSPMKWEVMVAPHATDGMGHCRMGSMYQLSPTKFYVAFTQFKTAGTDQEGGRLVARFVDVDFAAKTSVVGETRVIYDGIPNQEHPPAQPHFFKVKDGVILIFDQDRDLVTYKSTDECLTWTEIGRYSPSPRTFWLALDGVVQIQNGIYKDRIVAAGFAWAVNGTSSMFLRSMYSDDFGVTWQVGYDFDPVTIGLSKSMNETGVAVDTNNDLIFIVRNESTTGDRDTTTGKTFFKSTDGGKTITRFYPDTPFIAAVCQTGIFQFAQNPWEGVPKIITTAPINVGSRNGLKLRISYDNMQSTAWEYNIYPTSLVTGYTSIKRVSPHMLGIVCEYGGFNNISNVVINFINFKEVFNGSII